MRLNRRDLSPATDTSIDQLLLDSDAIISLALYRELRSRGHSAANSLYIVHQHNGYDYQSPLVPISQRFTKQDRERGR